jgi:hypothetical protein
MDADGNTTTHDRDEVKPSMGMRWPSEPRPSEQALKLLSIYLSDHHAGSTAGFELAKRAARHNAGTRIGAVLEDVVREIAADRRTLEQLMESLDAQTSLVKRAGAFLAERFARLKTNGRLFTYSPLSRVVELEGLALGILGKQALWDGLVGVPELQGRAGLDLTDLANRARSQHAAVEECRRQAVALAFGG